MAELTLIQNGKTARIPFDPPRPLGQILEEQGIFVPHPCGGRGVCGKCAVFLEGAVSEPTDAEKRAGCRFICQTTLYGNAAVWLPNAREPEQIEMGSSEGPVQASATGRLGAAVDIGTTTIALKLCQLETGAAIAVCGCQNPQTAVAADVIGRIEAALNGKLELLQTMVLSAVESLLETACNQASVSKAAVEELVITGNTTMLYLLTGRSPLPLSRAPFHADCLFHTEIRILGRKAYLPPCMNAFVGADITCAVLTSGMHDTAAPSLLCDIGTNGELALWKDGCLYVTSTAAGPAFEGAGISCGCGSVRGAIDRVWVEDGAVHCHTIADAPAVGLCGSGLIDAVAAFLQLGYVDETGAADQDSLPLAEGIALLPKDIRAVQLAKAAIAAGIQVLLESTGTKTEALAHFFICGGFGSHLDLDSAVAIGLFPASLKQKAQVLGNAALDGAGKLLGNPEAVRNASYLADAARHMNLGGNPKFNEYYVNHMLFPEEEY